MNKKKQNLDNKNDVNAEDSGEESDLEQMVGRQREEFSEDRQPATYHFCKDELQHKEDLIDRVSGKQ